MEEDETLFPAMDLEEVDVTDLVDNIPSASKWTYKMDYRNRRAVLDEAGRPIRTTSYEEFLVETAMKIICTERFQYVVYGSDIGVENRSGQAGKTPRLSATSKRP